MRGRASFVLAMAVLVLVPFAFCSKKETSSGTTMSAGSQRLVNVQAQLDCISASGPDDLAVLVGLRGSNRNLNVTTDGGKTWRTIASKAIGGMVECATLTKGNSRGWVINNDGTLLTTRSGGTNWTTIANLETLSNGDFTGASQIEFLDDTFGWMKELLSVWRTTDGGVTWNEKLSVLTPGVKGQPGRMYAIDANTLVVLGDGKVYLTRDGGSSWKIETLVTEEAGFTDVWFRDKKNGWLTGYISPPHQFRPLLFVTSDGGQTWKEAPMLDLPILPESVCFVSEQEGWVAGRRPIFTGEAVPASGVLMHTTDGGKHWTQVQFASDDPFFDLVRFIDQQHGWLVGRDNLYRTEDAGKNWTQVLSVPPAR